MNREDIDKKYKWDLSKIYESVMDFKNDIKFVRDEIPKFKKYDGIVYDENNLYELISLEMNTSRVLEKLQVYVSLLNDEDTSINKNRELKEEVANVVSEYRAATYFITGSILKLDYSVIEGFCLKNEKLREYEIYFKEMYRYKEHTLSDSSEKLLADLSKTFGNSYETYELIQDSDMTFPSFLVEGREYPLDKIKYLAYMEDNNRLVRKGAFETFYSVYRQFKNTFASLIIANIKEDVALAKVRNYPSAMEASFYSDELNSSIYNNLVDVVNKRMPVLHRYYELKRKVLGVEKLHLYDVYANLIVNDNFKYPFEEAKETVLKTLSIFGDEYISILKEGLGNRWVDVYPNNCKRSGAYSGGSYDTMPYVLLNYQNKYDDMSTLAHELGHSMHSYFTRHNNPYQYGDYAIFVAEVASTVNELLLAKYIIKNSTDREEKLFVMNRMMELFRATIYRQTMFAEFEKKIYDMEEASEPLTADIMGDIYYQLNQVYFGQDVVIDDEIRYEWERIPHFYYNFYVYKYATGLSAACYIVTSLLDGKIEASDYINFLKCGRSKSPLDSLKVAGVDLSDPVVINSALDMFDTTIKDFEELYFEGK